MSIAVSCPECEATLRVKDESAGKKIRCPKCQAVIPVAAADGNVQSGSKGRAAPPSAARKKEESSPRRKAFPPPEVDDDLDEESPSADAKAKRKKMLIYGGVGAGALVVVLTVILIVANSGGGNTPEKDKKGIEGPSNPRVTAQSLASLEPYMTRAKVEEILGQGEPSSLNDAENFLRSHNSGSAGQPTNFANSTGARNWSVWKDGDSRLYAAFGQIKADERLAFAFHAGRAGSSGQGYSFRAGAIASDSMAEREKQETMIDDSRYLRREALKKGLSGQWRRDGISHEFVFGANSLLEIKSSAYGTTRYKLLDDRTIVPEDQGPPDPNKRDQVAYRMLLEGDTLWVAKMTSDGKSLKGMENQPYKRAGPDGQE